MKKMNLCVVIIIVALLSSLAEATPEDHEFQACASGNGAGFFWIQTTTGQTWWADPGQMAWRYCGQPEGGAPAAIGTYTLFENKSGNGVFVLNTETGQGWWTDGKEWKTLGMPQSAE